ncbi:unnamed protein product, partial [Musa textilis]
VLPLQSGDWGGGTAPAKRCYHSSLATGVVPPPQPGGATTCVCVQGRFNRLAEWALFKAQLS